MTPKELFLETIKNGGSPDRLLDQYEAFQPIMIDPVSKFTRGNRKRGTVTKDRWGTTFNWPEDQYAGMPHVTDTDKVIPDITEWRKYVNVPDLVANCTDWDDAIKLAEETRAKGEKLVMGFMGTGVFEQCHYLMGFEDTLMNLLLEPEAMHELVEVIGEYRLTYAKLLVDNLKPDCILSHDDWGSKNALFMQPDTWREFYKPQYEKIYGYMHDHGVIVIHHGDSYQADIIEDMIDLNISVWQGVIPTNDIVALQKQTEGRITLMGGIDSGIDHATATEEEIRAEVRRACSTYGPGGHFIPSMTYGLTGTIFPHVEPIVSDEIGRYNKDTYGA